MPCDNTGKWTNLDKNGQIWTVPNFIFVTLHRKMRDVALSEKTDKLGQIRTNSDSAIFHFRNFAARKSNLLKGDKR